MPAKHNIQEITFDEQHMKAVVTWIDEHDVDQETKLPAKFEVCDNCKGKGRHMTPSMRDHAYSAEEFMEAFPEPEDRAGYFGGAYDVECTECHGERVVMVVDLDDLAVSDPDWKTDIENHLQRIAQMEAEDRHIQRMENMEY